MIDRNLQGEMDALTGRLERALAASELAAGLRRLADARPRLMSGRPLTEGERAQLKGQGNFSPDWARVRLGDGGGLESIRGNIFEGDVFLAGFSGSWPGPDGRAWPAGLTACRVRDAAIGNACLHQIARLENQVIDDGAILIGLGEITCPSPTAFGLGLAIHPGAETGARTLWLWDGLDLDDAMAALSLPAELQKAFQARLDGLLPPRSAFGYVGRGASAMHARQIQGAYLGPGSRVAGASLIRDSALLSMAGATPLHPAGPVPASASSSPSAPAASAPAAGAPTAAAADPASATDLTAFAGADAWIEKSILMPGSRVDSAGKASGSLLLGKGEVAWGGMVSQSVIGPGTQVQKGEVTASVLGPFVGFHHQSLLISALWPEGRGNIAYGANVGSNHTGKKPDQEIRPGEGNFFGLGCSIKFPANYEDAPYSLIATGVATAPQRVAFPFSLINLPLPGDGGSGAAGAAGAGHNEIVPGWMWWDNAYALARRMYKSESGDPDGRYGSLADPASTWRKGFFAGRLFAVELARKVLKAHQALRTAPAGRPAYLEDDLPGLGKNLLRGSQRERSLAAYADYLSFFLMRAYADRPGEAWSHDLSDLVTVVRKELAHGLEAVPDARSWIASQRSRLPAFRQRLVASLARDDKRGRQVFEEYAEFHPPAEADGAVARMDGDLAELGTRLDRFLAS